MDAISVDDLWLSYRARGVHGRTLKATLARVAQRRPPRDVAALKGVTFTVGAGEMLGVVGANGSGKSTLLRCLAGVFRPSRGHLTVRGRTASLIDLTAGFQRDLTARENVYLTGAIYGVPKATLDQRFDAILAFAGLEDHADDALRTFSMGMAMRLGFSVAVSLEPDVLLVDEVLAVGDESFRIQCLEKVSDMHKSGVTIVVVSHELALIRSVCERLLVLHHGEIAYHGPTEEGLRAYCKLLGVDLDAALSQPPIEPSNLRRIERAWVRRS